MPKVISRWRDQASQWVTRALHCGFEPLCPRLPDSTLPPWIPHRLPDLESLPPQRWRWRRRLWVSAIKCNQVEPSQISWTDTRATFICDKSQSENIETRFDLKWEYKRKKLFFKGLGFYLKCWQISLTIAKWWILLLSKCFAVFVWKSCIAVLHEYCCIDWISLEAV